MNSNQQTDFLLEIGTEELPPKQISGLAASLANNLEESLNELALAYREIKTFSSPRRLAVLIYGLANKQENQAIEIRGPSVAIAFDQDGKPTIPALKFAESCGVTVAKLKKIEDKKGTILFHQTIKPGKKTIELLPEIIAHSIKKLPMKRAMRWGENIGPFIRPVHWVVALFGNKIIKLELFGIKSSNKTFGHRFHYPKAIIIPEPSQYENLLEETGFVIADAEKRRQKIRDQISSLTRDDKAIISEALLAETTNLVEWPVALVGTFSERFLKIPHEVLITTLETQQRCFPITDEAGELLPRFIMISNIESKSPAHVITGNERVIQARLTDAEYFYQNDLKHDFATNLNKLKEVSFQDKLGSLYDKAIRLKLVVPFIAEKIGGDSVDAKRAAELAKCDLVTGVVREFPELQGVMGYYYAKAHEHEAVATAIKEQYFPRFSQDQIPETKIGIALSLADRLDNLVGLFALGKIPSGDKDPFGLRRAANGILRILLEKKLDLDLKEIIDKSCLSYKDVIKNKDELIAKVLDFIYERLRAFYIEENKNISIFRAVLASTPTNILDFTRRFDAVNSFIQLPESSDLVEIYKRIRNILDKNSCPDKIKFNLNLALEPVEHNLATLIEKETKTIMGLYHNKKYSELLLELVKLKTPLSDFFEKVMVMVEDEKLRNNRLALLKTIQSLFALIADLSYLVSGNKTTAR